MGRSDTGVLAGVPGRDRRRPVQPARAVALLFCGPGTSCLPALATHRPAAVRGEHAPARIPRRAPGPFALTDWSRALRGEHPQADASDASEPPKARCTRAPADPRGQQPRADPSGLRGSSRGFGMLPQPCAICPAKRPPEQRAVCFLAPAELWVPQAANAWLYNKAGLCYVRFRVWSPASSKFLSRDNYTLKWFQADR